MSEGIIDRYHEAIYELSCIGCSCIKRATLNADIVEGIVDSELGLKDKELQSLKAENEKLRGQVARMGEAFRKAYSEAHEVLGGNWPHFSEGQKPESDAILVFHRHYSEAISAYDLSWLENEKLKADGGPDHRYGGDEV